MKHKIPIEDIGPLANEMAEAVSKCVHCGFCLPACPTYNVLHQEMDSPRGRIILMKSVLEDEIGLEEAIPYLDHCLVCLGCETACPSGVAYGKLITPFRFYAESLRKRSVDERFSRWLTKETLPYPDRCRTVTQVGKIAKPISSGLPGRYKAMLGLIPEDLPGKQSLPAFSPVEGERKARVALHTGCVQQVLAQEINLATIRVLVRNGVEVVIPSRQICCGALALHTGDYETSKDLATQNIEAFPPEVDAIISNAAGCGSAMHEYPLLFQGGEGEVSANSFSEKVVDISVFLNQIGIQPIPPLQNPLKIAYHDACHLAHAQGVVAEPRNLLSNITGITILPIQEGDLCCGSAGSYNIEQPVIADQLGRRKINHILATGADAVVAGNIGCLIQIKKHLIDQNKENGNPLNNIPVFHTIELIDLAYRGKL